jgi:hypothetical protein
VLVAAGGLALLPLLAWRAPEVWRDVRSLIGSWRPARVPVAAAVEG